MQLQKASRKRVKIKMALQGPSGSGKTYSALLLAYGLCGDWGKVAVIDTENSSSELYAHLGEFQVLPIAVPFTPERYIQAIKTCEQEGAEVIIIDSISHEWEGIGGILQQHANMPGSNTYTNWNKLTPIHNLFVQHILQSSCHIIGTIRSKQEYVLTEKNGKLVPEKVGMKGVTRNGMDYEFTLVFETDMKNHATATKDRTSLFLNKPPFIISAATGKLLIQWCNEGLDNKEELGKRIEECKSLNELLKLFYNQPPTDSALKAAFTTKRLELEKQPTSNSLTQNSNSNGTHISAAK